MEYIEKWVLGREYSISVIILIEKILLWKNSREKYSDIFR